MLNPISGFTILLSLSLHKWIGTHLSLLLLLDLSRDIGAAAAAALIITVYFYQLGVKNIFWCLTL
jgi:hypothetical protein